MQKLVEGVHSFQKEIFGTQKNFFERLAEGQTPIALFITCPYIAFNHTPLKTVTLPLIQSLVIQPVTCGKAMLIAVGIGILAALWPSWQALRMNVVRALRNLE